ncbi:MAG: hypothetical protein ACQEVA_03735 [Myxococcota bacterium]
MRRLIPTVAAASLSFTGCLPQGGGNNGGGSSDGGGIDLGSSNNGGGGDVTFNDDGQISQLELQSFCQFLQDCDPENFQQSYGATVQECVEYLETNIEYYSEYYAQYAENPTECVNEWYAFGECQLSRAYCSNGEVSIDYSEPSCYELHDYYSVCYE